MGRTLPSYSAASSRGGRGGEAPVFVTPIVGAPFFFEGFRGDAMQAAEAADAGAVGGQMLHAVVKGQM